MNEKTKTILKKLSVTGFFSIFMSNVFAKVIAFFGNIVIVNILSKNDYGIYAYAINAMTMLYIFNDFGASNSALQSLTEEKDNSKKQKGILKYALKIGLTGSLISGILILLSPLFYPYQIIEAKDYTPILFLIPLFSNINSFISIVLRANLKNKRFAIFNLSQTFFNYFLLIFLSIKFGIIGAIISQYCYMIISLVIGLILSRGVLDKNVEPLNIDKKEKKSFLKYALTTQLNSTLGSILLNIDIFLIGIMIANSEMVATYKVATTIPMALSFLPNCVVIYILPYFIMHNKDIKWIKKNYFKLIKYGIVCYGGITLLGCLASKPLFNLLYGDAYNNSILIFNILMIGFFFSATFKIPSNNILYGMRKLKINLIVTISSSIVNFIFNILFINLFGIVGAAITTTLVQIFSSIILIYYVKKVLSNKECISNEKNSN